MASLDEEQANTIRRRLSTTTDVETVQKRVGTGVIRRRKRKTETGADEVQLGEVESESGADGGPRGDRDDAAGRGDRRAGRARADPARSPRRRSRRSRWSFRRPRSSAQPRPRRRRRARGFVPASTPVRVVEDPFAGRSPQAAAAESSRSAASYRRRCRRDAEPEPEAAPFAGRSRPQGAAPARPARADLTLREQETIARMMRGGNVQAQLERRRMLVEQQSRAQPQRKRADRRRDARCCRPRPARPSAWCGSARASRSPSSRARPAQGARHPAPRSRARLRARRVGFPRRRYRRADRGGSRLRGAARLVRGREGAGRHAHADRRKRTASRARRSSP